MEVVGAWPERGGEGAAARGVEPAQSRAVGDAVPVPGDRDLLSSVEAEAGNVDCPPFRVLGNLGPFDVVAGTAGIAAGDLQRLEAAFGEAIARRAFDPGSQGSGGAAADYRRRIERDAGDRGELDRAGDVAVIGLGDRRKGNADDGAVVADRARGRRPRDGAVGR